MEIDYACTDIIEEDVLCDGCGRLSNCAQWQHHDDPHGERDWLHYCPCCHEAQIEFLTERGRLREQGYMNALGARDTFTEDHGHNAATCSRCRLGLHH